MNKKRGGKVVAVIDIGSNAVKMRVAQMQNNVVKDLDLLYSPLRLGHEVFSQGKISFDSLRELSATLRGYSQVMTEYGVSQYKIVATTVFREAQNRAYVTDQLKIQNDMTIEVLEDDQEKTLIYSEILRNLSEPDAPKIGNALVAYIGTGSIGVALYSEQRMIFSQNISIGSLKLHDLLRGIQDETPEFYTVLDEYLNGIIGRIALPPTKKTVDSLIITGNEMELIAKTLQAPLKKKRYLIDASQMEQLFTTIRDMPPEKISLLYDMSESEAELLYTSLAIYLHILRLTDAKRIISPKIDLWDAVARQLLISKSKAEYDEHVRTSALSCAVTLAQHYQCNHAHLETVRSFACLVFDKLKKIHGLSNKRRLLLELAALLHECGYYVNSKYHLRSTFDLIKNTDIYGLTDEEVYLIAHVARYTEFFVPSYDDREYAALSEKSKLLVSKLVAIFRLANALDKSSKQKLQDVKVRLQEDTLVITAVSDQNVSLEKWAFDECAPFFEEVFGIKPQLVVKPLMF